MITLLLPQHNFDWLEPRLAMGTKFDSEEIPILHTWGFDMVLDLRAESFDDTPTLTEYNINYHRIPTADMLGFSVKQFKEGTKLLSNWLKFGKTVYMHCAEGLGRSPTMAIAYLMTKGFSLNDAYTFVKTKRPIILVTLPQVNSLKIFEKHLKEFSSQILTS